jgi:polyisoprenoid-binding protein YceI
MSSRLSAVLGVLMIIATPALGQPSTWVPDKAHSEVTFSILHLSLANVRGRFGDIRGTVRLDPSDILKSAVDVTIDVSTVLRARIANRTAGFRGRQQLIGLPSESG